MIKNSKKTCEIRKKGENKEILECNSKSCKGNTAVSLSWNTHSASRYKSALVMSFRWTRKADVYQFRSYQRVTKLTLLRIFRGSCLHGEGTQEVEDLERAIHGFFYMWECDGIIAPKWRQMVDSRRSVSALWGSAGAHGHFPAICPDICAKNLLTHE